MSEVVGEAVVRIRQDESGFNPAASGKKAGDGYAKGFTSGIKGIAVGVAGVLAVGKAVDFLKESTAEARESQKVTAQTVQTIKATGAAANVTADQVGNLSTAISNKTGIDDEAIQSGSNLILTFKNVRNEAGKNNKIFDEATKAAVDLSAAGFGSISGASVMLGKALNDPLKGISALGRAGVTFSQGQKDQITNFVKQGDLLSAQKIILENVKGQVGGVAAATATAGEKASVAWGNVKESVGTGLLPVLDLLANFFTTTIAPALQTVIASASGLGPVFKTIGSAISTFASSPAVGQFITNIADALIPALQTAADTFMTQVLPAIKSVGEYIITSFVPIFMQAAQILTGQIIPTIVQLATFLFGTLYPAIIQIYAAVAERLKPVFDTIVQVFQTQVLPAISALVTQIQTQLIPALEPVIVKVVAVIGFLAQLAATILGFVLPPLIQFAAFIVTNLLPVIVSLITFILKAINVLFSIGAAIGSAIGAVVRFGVAVNSLVQGALNGLVSAVASIPGRLLSLAGNFADAGKSLIRGFLNGLKNAGSFASGIADSIWGAVKGVINSAIDRLNALLDFTINVGPKSFHVSAPDIGHLQSGSPNVQGGVYTVGEVGPERVVLPSGAQVLTAAQTRQADAGAMDPHTLAAALAAALAPLLVRLRPVQFTLPTGDPEAAALATVNRLATV